MTVRHSEIHKLPDNLVSLIAAGEVIERPVSVVKELIENSLDAGARHIEVKLESGGLTSIVVRDDGHGIPSVEVPLLLERHTTSKIDSEDDLDEIVTLGFRGEALYSIGAVSDVILSTKHIDEQEGARLNYRDGEKSIETIPWPGGTQVESLRLFHSTPARRKFLRSASAEYGRVGSLISSYALAYPHVAWRLVHDGRETLRTPGTGNREDALVAVYGADVARKMLNVDFRTGAIEIEGAISAIELTRARRTDQVIFLNGRLIRDPGISAALERPYMQFLAPGRHPIAILLISCDPREVDVNVHPHKKEVRLSEPRIVTGSVYRAVENTLRKNHPLEIQKVLESEQAAESIEIDETTGEVRPVEPQKKDETDWAIREPKHRHTPDWPPQPETSQPRTIDSDQLQHQYPSFDNLDVPRDLPPAGHTIQFANTYLIYNQGRAIYIIDQHNLHERILYEEFISRENKAGTSSQALLFPVQVILPPALAALVDENMDILRTMGFELEEFSEGGGKRAYALRAVPQSLKDSDPSSALMDILEKASQDEKIDEPGGFRKAFAINLSCKSAIKAGHPLTEEEIAFLIAHIMDGTYVTCPHGRPTLIKLDEDWFRRSFKRSR